MHPYATDSQERKTIPLFIAAFAVVSAVALSRFLALIHWPGWIDAPATIGFYGFYFDIFRRWIWRIPLLHTLGIIKVPVLSGHWKGYVTTSYDELADKHPVEVEILQDWTHMIVKLRTRYSRSESLIGSILVGTDIVVDYEYRNEPAPGATDTMHAHRGSTTLRLSKEGDVLEGEYFSGRDRANYGAIKLHRE